MQAVSGSGGGEDGAARPAWIFGYGSLAWRPDFPFEERVGASLRGWRRRFWQGSTDHRGVPGSPGRVATLDREPEAVCWGVAYRVAEETRQKIYRDLDVREQGGYDLLVETIELVDQRTVTGATYIATPENPNYLGPAPVEVIARQVLGSTGPSGPNDEYVLELERVLRGLGVEDEHVFELAEHVRRGAVL